MLTIVELDRAAVQAGVAVVKGATESDLARPTPCAEWDLRALLDHMTVQHNGFAAAARGLGGDPAVWRTGGERPDPIADYLDSADAVLAAFAESGVSERDFLLPEIHSSATFPGAVAIGFHLVDYVVHGWDVARALGLAFDPGSEVTAAALHIAERVPSGPARLVSGSAFAPVLPAAGGSALDRTLRLLGRSPNWTA
ncbi:TIGR03086 family metal-binding protein [Rhodococcus sp. NPDC059234]|uniref:TIGR03086 family metal-binding protein n=1 Tax=Rhodococcus sp. NPDC059234 TaxID=3346781 RepID=UPI00366C2C81